MKTDVTAKQRRERVAAPVLSTGNPAEAFLAQVVNTFDLAAAGICTMQSLVVTFPLHHPIHVK